MVQMSKAGWPGINTWCGHADYDFYDDYDGHDEFDAFDHSSTPDSPRS